METHGSDHGSPDASTSQSVYVHRPGSIMRLEAEVLPTLQEGLVQMLQQMQQNALKVAQHVGAEDGQYLPEGWEPFSPLQHLGTFLLQQEEQQRQQQQQEQAPPAAAVSDLRGQASATQVVS